MPNEPRICEEFRYENYQRIIDKEVKDHTMAADEVKFQCQTCMSIMCLDHRNRHQCYLADNLPIEQKHCTTCKCTQENKKAATVFETFK